MRIHRPKNIVEYKKILSEIRKDSWSPYLAFFRGQSQDWPIISGVSRELKFSSEEILRREQKLFEEFLKSESFGFKLQQHFSKDKFKFAQKWLDLFQAQHLGLKTRLTDWTQSHENALSFAIQDKLQFDREGVLWIYKCPYREEYVINFNLQENNIYFDIDPFKLPETVAIKHYGMFDESMDYQGEKRRFRQHGSFIISSEKDLKKPIEEINDICPHLEKIIISPSLKEELLLEYLHPELDKYMYDKQDISKVAEFEKIEQQIKLLNLKHFS